MKWYKFCLYKAWFEKGYSLTNYVKYLIVLLGLGGVKLSATMLMAFIYAVSCFFIGWIWYKYGFVLAEHEVSNNNNKFVSEMRNRKT